MKMTGHDGRQKEKEYGVLYVKKRKATISRQI